MQGKALCTEDPNDSQSRTSAVKILRAAALLSLPMSPFPLFSKLSDNLQRELWALRGLGEIAPQAVLSEGAAGPRQCCI